MDEKIDWDSAGDLGTEMLFENGRVRIWRVDLEPGEATDVHTHELPYVLCVIEGESIDVEYPTGESDTLPVVAGGVSYVEPGCTERAINRSDTVFREFVVELK